jgi:hypothetical protein
MYGAGPTIASRVAPQRSRSDVLARLNSFVLTNCIRLQNGASKCRAEPGVRVLASKAPEERATAEAAWRDANRIKVERMRTSLQSRALLALGSNRNGGVPRTRHFNDECIKFRLH